MRPHRGRRALTPSAGDPELLTARDRGAVEDIARAAAFLACDEAKWITGAVLLVEGGMVIQ